MRIGNFAQHAALRPNVAPNKRVVFLVAIQLLQYCKKQAHNHFSTGRP